MSISFSYSAFTNQPTKFDFRFADQHLPLKDDDNDRFSDINTFRGAHWRGRDCNDSDPNVYPGRKPVDFDQNMDYNCNGIFVSHKTPYFFDGGHRLNLVDSNPF